MVPKFSIDLYCLRWRKEFPLNISIISNMKPIPGPVWTVHRTLQAYPQAAFIFIQLHTDCIGCPLARFCTLAEVEIEFHLSPGSLIVPLRELSTAQDPRREV